MEIHFRGREPREKRSFVHVSIVVVVVDDAKNDERNDIIEAPARALPTALEAFFARARALSRTVIKRDCRDGIIIIGALR